MANPNQSNMPPVYPGYLEAQQPAQQPCVLLLLPLRMVLTCLRYVQQPQQHYINQEAHGHPNDQSSPQNGNQQQYTSQQYNQQQAFVTQTLPQQYNQQQFPPQQYNQQQMPPQQYNQQQMPPQQYNQQQMPPKQYNQQQMYGQPQQYGAPQPYTSTVVVQEACSRPRTRLP
jgi:hypothetical protein